MIDFIRGTLANKEIAHVSVEAHGVGYGISIPLSTYEKLPLPGEEVFLHIHYYVREDAHKLYGFFTKEERELFRQLIGVTKIGPKVALSILSGISVADLIASVNSADPSRLEKIPGVGAKTASRLMMELRGKVGAAPFAGLSKGTLPAGAKASGGKREEVFAAMISLGYNDKQVERALSRVGETLQDDADAEEWIRKALQVI
jgi:Holliday junction DNA helicase RuvA